MEQQSDPSKNSKVTRPPTEDSSIRNLWQESGRLWLPALRRAWIWLTFSICVEEAFSALMAQMSKSDERLYIAGAFVALLFQLLLSAIGIIIVNQMIFEIRIKSSQGLIASLRKNLKYVFIESTRALLPVLVKCIFFIVPGVVEGIRLYFVPYIAQFDEKYKTGKVDALDRSRALVRGHFWTVTGILILTLVLSMVPRLYLESISVIQRPAYYFFIFFVSLSAELYGDIVVFMTYIRLEEKIGNSISLS